MKILKELESYKQRDFFFSSGHILGSMCTQHILLLRRTVRYNFYKQNLGDPEICPALKKLNLASSLLSPSFSTPPKKSAGQIVMEGTEGNITAMWDPF